MATPAEALPTSFAPTAPSQDQAGSNLPQMPWEQASPLIQQYESSGGQNVMNWRYPEDPSKYTASGPWQITDTNLRNIGQQLGIDTTQYQHAMDAPRDVQEKIARQLYEKSGGWSNWAPFNPKLRASLESGRGGAAPGMSFEDAVRGEQGGPPADGMTFEEATGQPFGGGAGQPSVGEQSPFQQLLQQTSPSYQLGQAVGGAEVAGMMFLGNPINAANDFINLVTGTDVPPPFHLGEAGQAAIAPFQDAMRRMIGLLRISPANLPVSDDQLKEALDPSGKIPIEQLRALYDAEKEKPMGQILLDSGVDLNKIPAPIRNTVRGANDIAQILPLMGAGRAVQIAAADAVNFSTAAYYARARVKNFAGEERWKAEKFRSPEDKVAHEMYGYRSGVEREWGGEGGSPGSPPGVARAWWDRVRQVTAPRDVNTGERIPLPSRPADAPTAAAKALGPDLVKLATNNNADVSEVIGHRAGEVPYDQPLTLHTLDEAMQGTPEEKAHFGINRDRVGGVFDRTYRAVDEVGPTRLTWENVQRVQNAAVDAGIGDSPAVRRELVQLRDRLIGQKHTGTSLQRDISKLYKDGYAGIGDKDAVKRSIGEAKLQMADVLLDHLGEQLEKHPRPRVNTWQFIDARRAYAQNRAVYEVLRGSNQLNMAKLGRMYQKSKARFSGDLAVAAQYALDNPMVTGDRIVLGQVSLRNLAQAMEKSHGRMADLSKPGTWLPALGRLLNKSTRPYQALLGGGGREWAQSRLPIPDRHVKWSPTTQPGQQWVQEVSQRAYAQHQEGRVSGATYAGPETGRELPTSPRTVPEQEFGHEFAPAEGQLPESYRNLAKQLFGEPPPPSTPSQLAAEQWREQGYQPPPPEQPEPRAVPYMTRRPKAAGNDPETLDRIQDFHRQQGAAATGRARSFETGGPREQPPPDLTRRAMRQRQALQSAENEVNQLRRELQQNPRNQATLDALREAERRLRDQQQGLSDMDSDLQ